MPTSNIPDDDDLGLETLLALPVQPAKSVVDGMPDGSAATTPPPKSPFSGTPIKDQAPLSESDLRYLSAVIDSPGKPSSAYASLAGMAPKRATLLRQQLLAAGYLRQHVVATGQRGREAMVLEPTEAAKAAVANAALSNGKR